MQVTKIDMNQSFSVAGLIRASFKLRIFTFYFLLFTSYLLLFTLTALTIHAQEEEFPEFRPTPKIEISKDEKKLLESENDVKKHTRLAIDLMEARIKKSEMFAGDGYFDEMLKELGVFHALMLDTLEFLNKNDPNRGKVLDNFKRFEMALRAYTPRIEKVRRESPERFDYYLIGLLKTVRETRAKAVEPFFSETVTN